MSSASRRLPLPAWPPVRTPVSVQRVQRDCSDPTSATGIIYTQTDEAPLLATYSFLPIVQAYAAQAGVPVETRDISLAGRIIAAFADRLPEDQRTSDALAELGDLAKRPEANIIKLPNISASIPQLKAAVAELRDQGYDLPAYPDEPKTDDERDARARYDKVKGSAVNPVLREGNSDRRAPESVKQYARNHPHSMGAWSSDSRTRVATMDDGDFRHSEQSVVMTADDTLRIEHVGADGTVDGAQGVGAGPRRRGRRLHPHGRRQAACVPLALPIVWATGTRAASRRPCGVRVDDLAGAGTDSLRTVIGAVGARARCAGCRRPAITTDFSLDGSRVDHRGRRGPRVGATRRP